MRETPVLGTVAMWVPGSADRAMRALLEAEGDIAVVGEAENGREAVALAKELTQLSLPEIGSNFGGRDHTTVMYACEKVADLLERDDKVRRQVVQIRQQLYA